MTNNEHDENTQSELEMDIEARDEYLTSDHEAEVEVVVGEDE